MSINDADKETQDTFKEVRVHPPDSDFKNQWDDSMRRAGYDADLQEVIEITDPQYADDVELALGFAGQAYFRKPNNIVYATQVGDQVYRASPLIFALQPGENGQKTKILFAMRQGKAKEDYLQARKFYLERANVVLTSQDRPTLNLEQFGTYKDK